MEIVQFLLVLGVNPILNGVNVVSDSKTMVGWGLAEIGAWHERSHGVICDNVRALAFPIQRNSDNVRSRSRDATRGRRPAAIMNSRRGGCNSPAGLPSPVGECTNYLVVCLHKIFGCCPRNILPAGKDGSCYEH